MQPQKELVVTVAMIVAEVEMTAEEVEIVMVAETAEVVVEIVAVAVERNDGARRCRVAEFTQHQGGVPVAGFTAQDFGGHQMVHVDIGLVEP